MEKNYLRYVSQWHGGVICSPRCNIAYDAATGEVVCGSVRDVVTWNLRTGERVRTLVRGDEGGGVASGPLDGTRGEVVAVAVSGGTVAAAYAAGLVRLWRPGADPAHLGGHGAAVGALRFTAAAAHLATGGANGDLVVYDVVAARASCRLRGHRAAVTDLCCLGDWDGPGRRVLVSTARDGLVKAWDVGARACVQTLTGAGGGVAVGADFCAASNRLATAAGDRELRLWAADLALEAPLAPLGGATRAAMEPAQELRFAAPRALCVLAHGRSLEVYALRDAAAAEKKARRRVKRRKERGLAGAADEAVVAADELDLVAVVESDHRLRSFCVLAASATSLTLALATRTNALEARRVALDEPARGKRKAARAPAGSTTTRAVALPGHRSAVRAVALSGDGDAVATCAQHAVKVWSADAAQAAAPALYRTFETPKLALCVCFLPGDAYLAVGCKDGRLLVCDVASSKSTEATDADGRAAHAGAVFAACASTSATDGAAAALVTAGADPEVKRWAVGADGGLAHDKTLDVGEECLAAAFVRDARGKRDGFVVVATLDHCVRVVYADSFKFKVALYGHALNCLCAAGSSDGKLLATGGADKTVKLWGLEFGDLRRSILAHDDAVTCVAFVRGTHYALSGSKDGAVKQWDCDRQDAPFVQQFRRGHASEVWALCVSVDGARVFTAGADRSLRCWARTDEPVFAAEEQEALLDATLDRLGDGLPVDADADADADGAAGAAALVPTRSAPAAAKGAERLAEALELAQGEAAARAAALAAGKAPPPPSMLMLGLDPVAYAVRALGQLAAADLEPALLVLPVDLVAVLLGFLADATEGDGFVDAELCARGAVFALQLHHRAVAAHEPLRRPLRRLAAALRARLDAERRLLGRNLAAVRVAGLRLADA